MHLQEKNNVEIKVPNQDILLTFSRVICLLFVCFIFRVVSYPQMHIFNIQWLYFVNILLYSMIDVRTHFDTKVVMSFVTVIMPITCRER